MNVEQRLKGLLILGYFFPAEKQEISEYQERSQIKQVTYFKQDGGFHPSFMEPEGFKNDNGHHVKDDISDKEKYLKYPMKKITHNVSG
jgi:hypothetical protein